MRATPRSLLPLVVLAVTVAGCGGDGPSAASQSGGWTAAATSIARTRDGGTLWVVNPDADSVTPIDTATLTAGPPVPVGAEPWAVAATPHGVIVMNRRDGTLTVLSSGRAEATIPIGPEPGGLAVAPDGTTAYVTVSGSDEVVVVDLVRRAVVARIPVGRLPWSVATTSDDEDGHVVVVTHRIARRLAGASDVNAREAWLSVVSGGRLAEEIALGPTQEGIANALESVVVADGHAWIAHKIDRPNGTFSFHTTVSGGLTGVPIAAAADAAPVRLDTNAPDFSTPVNFPRAVAVTGDGSKAYVALAGSDLVMGVALGAVGGPRLLGFWPVGQNPRGIVLDEAASHAYVMNYLSRDVSVLDLSDTVRFPEIARISTVRETLEPTLLSGKRLFHLAADPRLSTLGWISCATCHLDGGSDGTTWPTPEGPRQTMPLWRLAGSAPFHASATRDEIQDFDHDIVTLMGGVGLSPAPRPPLLGEPASGRSDALDALAAFVLTGIRPPKTHTGPGAAPVDVAAGRALFVEVGCAECHGGPRWSRSRLPGAPGTLGDDGASQVVAVLRDVGTHDPGAPGLGAAGFDVPTLLGLHATTPYLHDGSADTLADVLANDRHVGRALADDELARLAVFLASIDESTPSVE